MGQFSQQAWEENYWHLVGKSSVPVPFPLEPQMERLARGRTAGKVVLVLLAIVGALALIAFWGAQGDGDWD